MAESADLTNRNIGISYISAFVGLSVVLSSIQLLRRKCVLRKSQAAIKPAEDTQCTALVAFLKAEVLYAPLWRLRRAKEASYLHHTINFGQLPPRAHMLCVFAFLCLNIFLVTWNLPWSAQATTLIPLLRNRLGSVAVANLILIVVASTIQNPLINLLRIPYDSFNLIHRWIGRITILEVITHGLCNIIGVGIHQGWDAFRNSLSTPYIHDGLAAAIVLALVFILSLKPLRSLAYEAFHYLHMSLIIVAFSFIWLHLNGHYQQYYLLVAVVLWASFRAFRFINTTYRSFGFGTGNCTAYVEKMPADALRVTLVLARPWKLRPGQSLYLNIPRVSFWASHPFSIAWEDESIQMQSDSGVEKGSNSTKNNPLQQAISRRAMCLIIKRRKGMTDSLFRLVEASERRMKFSAYVQGPYGITNQLGKYGSVLLFAAGVGITHQLPFVKQIIKDCALGKNTIKRARLIWVVPYIDMVDWIQPWLHEVFSEDEQLRSSFVFQISLFVTRHDGNETKLQAYSRFADVTPARPNVFALVGHESTHRQGKMFVSVCATGSLADDVRENVRRLLRKQVNVDFHEEGFGW